MKSPKAVYRGTIVMLLLLVGSSFAANKDFILYSFQGGNDGGNPYAGLITDKAGNLYGTTRGANGLPGNVFKLTAPATKSGAWVETILYDFSGANDGFEEFGNLVFDLAGNLYGTTKFGGTGGPLCQFGGCGTVYRLSPPSGGQGMWTETILYNFLNSTDGGLPSAGLVVDKTGNLYGTAFLGGNQNCACGTVFELSPPAQPGGTWTMTVLHSFNGFFGGDGQTPQANLSFDPKGNLYGTAVGGGTSNSGTVFTLTPDGHGGWAYSSIYNFLGGFDGANPYSTLLYLKGNFFGTTFTNGNNGSGLGTVFELTPPVGGGAWTETTIFTFPGTPGPAQCCPLAGVITDASGNLYGTASGFSLSTGGTVFKLAPPGTQGGKWTPSNVHVFGALPDGFQPRAPLVFGKFGALYGTTVLGGDLSGDGTVFAVLP